MAPRPFWRTSQAASANPRSWRKRWPTLRSLRPACSRATNANSCSSGRLEPGEDVVALARPEAPLRPEQWEDDLQFPLPLARDVGQCGSQSTMIYRCRFGSLRDLRTSIPLLAALRPCGAPGVGERRETQLSHRSSYSP